MLRGLESVAPGSIPADHGYILFAAVRQVLPWIHGDRRVGIHPLRGRLAGQRTLLLDERVRLVIRVPVDLIPALLPLAGQVLDVAGSRVAVGTPDVRALVPRADLFSRLVVIRGYVEPGSFLEAARQQLGTIGVSGDLYLARRQARHSLEGRRTSGSGEWLRRTLRVGDREIVGYAVEIRGLSSEDSIRLQSAGLGGRRRFGCGIFVPARAVTP